MAASSSVLKIEQIGGKGRGLLATQDLKAGQVILTESPLILYSASPLFSSSSSSSPFSYCDHCFKIIPKISETVPCPSCPYNRFCNHNCLSIALTSSHTSFVCHVLSQLRHGHVEQYPERQQVQARLVVAAYNLFLQSPSDLDVLLNLHGTPDKAILDSAQFIHSRILPFCPSVKEFFSVELVARIIAKDRINSFCLMDPYSPNGPQRNTKAFAIYPKATFFNHDCIPNACRFDHVNNEIVFRLIEDVPQGNEVCISYFRIGRDYSTRKKILMEDYGFVCQCDRCKIEMNWNEDVKQGKISDVPHVRFLNKFVCDRENCAGTMAPLPRKDDATSNVLECNFCGNLKIASA